jgi:Holliday junction resolvase
VKKELAVESGQHIDELGSDGDADDASDHGVHDVLQALDQGVLSLDEAASMLE